MFTEEEETVKLIREAVYQAESAACQPDLMILEPSSNLSPHLYLLQVAQTVPNLPV